MTKPIVLPRPSPLVAAVLAATLGCAPSASETTPLRGEPASAASPAPSTTASAAASSPPRAPRSSTPPAPTSSDAGTGAQPGASSAPFGEPQCGSGFLLCDSFEQSAFSNGWNAFGTELPIVDGARPARGKMGVHITTMEQSLLEQNGIFPISGGTYYVRFFVYFNQLPQVDWTHFSLLYVEDHPYDGPQLRLGGTGDHNGNYLTVGTDGGPTGDWGISDDTAIPLKTWLCLETMISSANNEMRVWKDDVELSSLHLNQERLNAENHPGFVVPNTNWLRIGYRDYHQLGMEAELFIDEVAIDTTRIGCGR